MKIEDEIQQKQFKNEFQKATVNLIYTHSWLVSRHKDFFKDHGITMQQFNILRILRGQHPKPATVSLLRDRMLDKMSDVSRIIERLRQSGLVSRGECEQDRRQVDILVTQKGLDLLANIDVQNEHMEERMLDNLSQEEVCQLNQLLDKARG